MIVCPEISLLYIHIYKTGGTSLTEMLTKYTTSEFRSTQPKYTGDGFQETWHFCNQQHSKYLENIKMMSEEQKDKIAHYDVLTVVRNPYAWFFSLYKEFYSWDKRETSSGNSHFGSLFPNRTLEDFLKYIELCRSKHTEIWGATTQASFVEGVNSARLHIVRFENYDQEIRSALNNKGITINEVPHALDRGESKRKELQEATKNRKFIDFVNFHLDEDFRNFSYPKETMSSAASL